MLINERLVVKTNKKNIKNKFMKNSGLFPVVREVKRSLHLIYVCRSMSLKNFKTRFVVQYKYVIQNIHERLGMALPFVGTENSSSPSQNVKKLCESKNVEHVEGWWSTGGPALKMTLSQSYLLLSAV